MPGSPGCSVGSEGLMLDYDTGPSSARLMSVPRPVLPRSRHRPRASTEGRARENINKNGVRLWTACSSKRHWEVANGRRRSLHDAAELTAGWRFFGPPPQNFGPERMLGRSSTRSTQIASRGASTTCDLEAPPGFEPGMEVLYISSGCLSCRFVLLSGLCTLRFSMVFGR